MNNSIARTDKILNLSFFSSGYYRVAERSAGEWQTMCIKKPENPTMNSLKAICKSLGFPAVTKVEFQLIDSEQISSKYRNSDKIVNTNQASMLRLNNNFNVTLLRPSQNESKIIPWDADDNKNCYQLEIKCTT